MNRAKLLLATLMLIVAPFANEARGDTFSVLTYNVRGIPPPVIEDRTAQMAAIAPKLEDFHTAGGGFAGIESVVLLQELFHLAYYNTLTSAPVNYAFETAKDNGGPSGIGDGLNILSDFLFTGFDRTQWTSCFGTGGLNGSDCDTNKGYSYSRHQIAPETTVDFYNLHADAGQDSGSRAARRSNITQLVAAINARSPAGTAFIVMGDTNSLYTRTPNDNIASVLTGTGATDVWVELVKGGTVPVAGPDNDSGCDTNPSGPACELIDKVFYRSGTNVTLTPIDYDVLNTFFSDGSGNDLSDHFPVSVTFDLSLGTPTTTVSTSSTSLPTTTTTMVPPVACADPVALIARSASEGLRAEVISATDALYILQVSVGLLTCQICVCDVDGGGSIAATDALITLRKAVNLPATLNCPPCS
jgi:hypothetical protein